MVLLCQDTDLDLFFSIQMIQCIACIICHDFFNFKFICPYIDRLFCIKADLCLFLLDHDIHRLQNSPYQSDNIKAFYGHFISSGFQLIQSKKVTNQLIHLRCLIHDNIAVKLPAFRIFGNIFFQSFCISLNQCDWSFQLMRNIIQELLSHLIDSFFILNVFL